MHAIPILGELILILTVSAVVIWAFQPLRQPAILGFLVSGVILGPLLGVVEDRERIEVMAEIGVVLLLFSIGVEFSLGTLARMRKEVLGGGLGQLVTTGLVVFLLALGFGYELRPAVFVALLIALSSTAIVMRLLGDRGELDAPHGRLAVGILILQDMAVVLLMLLVPVLATGAGQIGFVLLALGRALATAGLIFLAARFVIPWLLDYTVRTRNRELFTLVTVLVAIGTAWLMGVAGLSLAIGAFVAGLVVSESPWSHHMMSEMRPLRDVFNGLFFVSVGLLVNPDVLADRPLVILGLVPAVIVVKGVIAAGVALLLGLGPRVAVLAGGALAQVGEFSFVLAQQGVDAGILDQDEYATFIAVTVGTMMVTPFVLQGSHFVARRVYGVTGWRGPKRVDGADLPDRDHAVIIGYGINGRNVARVLRWLEVPYVVVELNSKTVNDARDREEPFVFGDATRELVLRHVGVERARVLVVAIADPSATRAIVTAARALRPDLPVVVRTRYVREVLPLQDLGVSQVVPEEYETSIELAAQALYAFGVAPRAVARARTRLRQQSYALLRRTDEPTEHHAQERLAEILEEIDVVDLIVEPGSRATGQTLGQLDLRATTGASVLAVLRGEQIEVLPMADYRLQAGDVIVVVGHGAEIEAVRGLVTGPPRPVTPPP